MGKGAAASRAWETLRRVTLSADEFSRGSLVGLLPMVKGCIEGRPNAVAYSITDNAELIL